LIRGYYDALKRPQLRPADPQLPSSADLMVGSVRNYALHVRGEAHLHQYYPMARALYGPHDEWFRSHLGFTIDEAILVAEALFAEYARRMNDGRRGALEKAEAMATEQGYIGSEKEAMKSRFAIHLFFGNSDKVLAFTTDDLAVFSGVSTRQSCAHLLERLSQEFGYRNPQFPGTFENPSTAPWDYNTRYTNARLSVAAMSIGWCFRR